MLKHSGWQTTLTTPSGRVVGWYLLALRPAHATEPHASSRRKPQMTLNVGDLAPDFQLKSHQMKSVSLAEARGKKVLLLTVPLAFTPG